MAENWTPGPWEANAAPSGWYVQDAERSVVCDTDCSLSECEAANAHLIAAAPEVYRQLATAYEHVSTGGVPSAAWMRTTRRVLAKARSGDA